MANSNGSGTSKGALSALEIIELMSKSKRKGEYQDYLLKFANESDELGVNPRETDPALFGAKSADAMKQSFKLHIAKAGLEGKIQVIGDGEDVYLIHTERMAAATADA